jgi:hypothetical protein
MEKTDSAVISYLDAVKDRLSGNALKIAFEIVMRWRFSDDEWLCITYEDFADETILARGTVIAAVREAKSAKFIDRKRQGCKFCYRPNFERVQNLNRPGEKRFENSPKEPRSKEITERLFGHWQKFFEADGAKNIIFSRDRRRLARRVLNRPEKREVLAAYRLALQALKGYAGTDSATRKFEEIFASPESLEKGIVRYEFLRTQKCLKKGD